MKCEWLPEVYIGNSFLSQEMRIYASGYSLRKILRKNIYPRIFTVLCLSLGLILSASTALKAQQAIERNLPSRPQAPDSSLKIDEPDSRNTNDKPLGVNVVAVRLLGPNDAVLASAPAGISFGKIEGISISRLEMAVEPFLKRPMSEALIADIRTAVIKEYRRAGYPFVAVGIPPQEITTGSLQLRVVEFKIETVKVDGAVQQSEENILRNVRAEQGDRIASPRLEEDLEWLNRSPYRRVAGEFAPGNQPGTSGLTLQVTESKPWQFLAGWSNTGSENSGRSRYFVGGAAWIPALNGLTFSYQITGSEDLLESPDKVQLDDGNRPAYLSHAARITLPTFSRQSLELAPNFVATHQAANIFITFDNDTFELPIIYRSALSNILPNTYLGDIYGGVEFKTTTRKTSFIGIPVGEGTADLFHIIAGWSLRLSDAWGSTLIDTSIKVNPGGVLGYNTDYAWNNFTAGRVTDATYAYGLFDVQRSTPLPVGFSLRTQIVGIISNMPLPDTERLGLGGMYTVRGYVLEDATVDSGFVMRNELRMPDFTPLATAGAGINDQLSPYLFVDMAYGRSIRPDHHEVLASLGIGFDYTLGTNINASVSAGYAMIDSYLTKASDWTVQGRISLSY
jgi:hemolysin activation/secretion protein